MVQHVIEEALKEELSASLGVARYAPLPMGSPTGVHATWELSVCIDHAVRPHRRPARAQTASGQRRVTLAKHHALRALLGAASGPTRDGLLFGAQSAGFARDDGLDPGRDTLACRLSPHCFERSEAHRDVQEAALCDPASGWSSSMACGSRSPSAAPVPARIDCTPP